MKINFIILFAFLFTLPSIAQNTRVNWGFNLNAGSSSRAYAMAQDASGNTYITGYFQGTVDFDPSGTTNNLVSAGGTDIFVAKYDSDRKYVWAFRIGSTSGAVPTATEPATEAGLDLTVDKSNNVIVTGTFLGTNIEFNPGAGSNTLSSEGSRDIFVAKYDTDGNYLGAFDIGSTNDDIGRAVITDGSENIYITGEFNGTTVDFDPSAGSSNLASQGAGIGLTTKDVYIAKYDKDLAHAWSQSIGGVSEETSVDIVLANSDADLFITGGFNGTANFDPSGTNNLTANGLFAGYLAKYTTAAGALTDAFQFGGTGLTETTGGVALATDGTSHVYITGGLAASGGADFDPSGGTATLTSTATTDIFVARYTLALAYDWAINIGKSNTNSGLGIDVGGTSVYITGQFYDTDVDFDPSGTTNNLSSAGVQDIFFLELTAATGAYSEAFSVGSTSDDVGHDIVVDGSGNFFITGYFNGTNTDFDPEANTFGLTATSDDIFLIKYLSVATAVPVELLSFQAKNTTEGHFLTWETATELDNSHFDIEWSTDGYQFEKIGQVDGAGTTLALQSYEFLNKDYSPKMNYYRLKQVDFDGAFEYSDVISIMMDEAPTTFQLFPNPAIQNINIQTGGQGLLQIVDITGRILKEINVNGFSTVDISDLSNGLHFVRLNNTVQKLMIQK